MSKIANQVVTVAKPHLKKFWYYAKVELAPPKPSEIPAAIAGFGKILSGFKKGNWKNATVKQAVLNGLITTEVICWFFVGECIGKGGIIGYNLH